MKFHENCLPRNEELVAPLGGMSPLVPQKPLAMSITQNTNYNAGAWAPAGGVKEAFAAPGIWD